MLGKPGRAQCLVSSTFPVAPASQSLSRVTCGCRGAPAPREMPQGLPAFVKHLSSGLSPIRAVVCAACGALRGGCAQRRHVNLQVLPRWPGAESLSGKVPDHASWLEGPDTPGPVSKVPQSPPVLSSVPEALQGPLLHPQVTPGDF